MWFEFFCAVAFLTLLILLPGALLLRAFSFTRTMSVALAPIVSVFLLVVLSIAFPFLGIAYSWDIVSGCTIGASLIVFLISLLMRKRTLQRNESASSKDPRTHTWLRYGLYLAVGIALTGVLFVLPLDGAASFVQDSDNSWHLAVIKSFADSARMSLLDVTLYPDFPTDQLSLVSTEATYYPAVWHLLAALLAQAFNAPVSLAANATNTVLLMLVFPSALYAMVSTLFRSIRGACVFGALFGLAFVAFPWGLLMPPSGPLYPCFLGFLFIPYAVALSLQLMNGEQRDYGFGVVLALLLLCLFDMAAAHPTSLFTWAVFLFPYGVYRIGMLAAQRFADSPRKTLRVVLACTSFVIGGFIIWIACFNFPALQSVVRFRWDAFASAQQEILNILTLAFCRNSTQIALGILVLAGIVYTLYRRKFLWISCSYALACLICFVGATNDGLLKNFLAGFWYTDPNRTAAMVAIIGIPLAILGARAIVLLVIKAAELVVSSATDTLFTRRIIPILTCATMLICVFYPDFTIPGAFVMNTRFGDYLYCMKVGNAHDRDNLFDGAEMAFTQEVRKIVGDEVVYNNADDGSVFAYEFSDLQLCYRRSTTEPAEAESKSSELLRLHIDEVGTNEAVRQVIAEANIRYVLVLDYGGEVTAERCFYGYYTPEMWSGMNAITDDTPGLETVLSEGDMRLYRVTV